MVIQHQVLANLGLMLTMIVVILVLYKQQAFRVFAETTVPDKSRLREQG